MNFLVRSSFIMVAMWALVAVLLTLSTVSQASLSEHATATATAENWTPRKPYAESVAFPQGPQFGVSDGTLAGTLFGRQNGKS